MSPLRAARSRRLTAASLSAAVDPGVLAFLSAVRSAERCARLRRLAARDFLMFFFADAIFGTPKSPIISESKLEKRDPNLIQRLEQCQGTAGQSVASISGC